MKNELLISGVALSPTDEEELQALLPRDEIEVHRLETKGFTDLVQVVFNDFSAVSFVRDLIIGEVFALAYAQIKPVIQHLRRQHQVDTICIEKAFVTEDQVPFTLYVVSNTAQFDQLISSLDNLPTEQLTPRGRNSMIVIRYDEQGRIEITEMD